MNQVANSMRMSKIPDDSPRPCQPGQIVPTSGVYTAVHHVHRSSHDVIAIQGEEFPPCRLCKHGVRFYIACGVPHMTHDFDLTGPVTREVKRRVKVAAKGE
jgi:hypothetical protein